MRTLVKHGPVRLQRLAIPTLLGVLALASLGGCGGSSDGESSTTAALTENDFALDASMVADPERGVVVDLLESAGSTPPEQDTADVGSDVIPYEYTGTVTNTFCWDDDDPEAGHVMTLIDSAGEEILELQANGACVTATIEPGEYGLRLAHDNRSAETLAVFVEALNGAQSEVDRNVETVLRTNKCPGCYLGRAQLAKARLANADLTGAFLIRADLRDAILTGAQLGGADLREAVLIGANLDRAFMVDAFLPQADLFRASLIGVNLFRADLTSAVLREAKLAQAELSQVNLTRATLVQAAMFDVTMGDATLVDADLTDADLENAFLCRTNFSGASADRCEPQLRGVDRLPFL